MKTCLICTDTRQPDEAETCSLCGEASWSESAPPAPETKPEPKNSQRPPQSRRS